VEYLADVRNFGSAADCERGAAAHTQVSGRILLSGRILCDRAFEDVMSVPEVISSD
jgi:hypothetical protein